jgi:hypothetical protein
VLEKENIMSDTPVVVPVWKIEFDKRVEAFAKAIRLDEPKVREILEELGADGAEESSLTILDSDEYLPFGDLRAAFVDPKHTKIGILRMAMPHLRAKTHSEPASATTGNGDSAIHELIKSSRPKSEWSDEELLNAYDETATDVAEIIGKKTRGRPCIVFQKDGSVDNDISLKLIKIAKRQPTQETHTLDNGKLVFVYRPGEFLAKALEESPFYPGVALVDGYCSKSGTQWNNVDLRNRILCRLHAAQIETAALTKLQMADLCKSAWEGHGFDDIVAEAVALYEKLEAQDKLPKLKVFASDAMQNRYNGKIDRAF